MRKLKTRPLHKQGFVLAAIALVLFTLICSTHFTLAYSDNLMFSLAVYALVPIVASINIIVLGFAYYMLQGMKLRTHTAGNVALAVDEPPYRIEKPEQLLLPPPELPEPVINTSEDYILKIEAEMLG